MNWIIIVIVVVVVGFVFVMKKSGQISAETAVAYLKSGAMVIDVRSPGEFSAGHLAQAINIPLNEIETAFPQRVIDKNQVLLLHCASGMRSGVAQRKLKGMGYVNAFNLGSYVHAEAIVGKQPSK